MDTIVITSEDVAHYSNYIMNTDEQHIITDSMEEYKRLLDKYGDNNNLHLIYYIPDCSTLSKKILIAVILIIKCNARSLKCAIEIVKRQMGDGETDRFFQLVTNTAIPISVIEFIHDMLDADDYFRNISILHPRFDDAYRLIMISGLSGAGFLAVT